MRDAATHALAAPVISSSAKLVENAYRAHSATVYRRARWLVGSDAEAREIVHDVFVSLLSEPAQFDGAGSILAWLYSATTHRCLNRLRDERNRQRLVDQNVAATAERAYDGNAEHAAALREVLVRLPADLAHAAVYYYLDEMTHAEIAAVLGCSRRHVGDLLVRLEAWAKGEERAG